jgi:predicted Zn-dependent protease
MRIPAYRFWIPLAAAVLLTRCSCDFFGATGALLISENDEMRLGRQFDSTLVNTDSGKIEFPVYAPKSADSQKVVAYVTNLAQEILQGIPKDERPGYDFKFTLIDKDVINAFAVPGGYVYIYTGIIKNMKDESELTCVLGHEIAHVTQHHYRDAMAKEAGLSILLQVLLGNDAGQLAQMVGQTFYSLAGLKVSRGNESEADFYGTKYAGSIGRNPLGVAKFFGRMPEEGLASWVSTHPAPEDRVKDVQDEVSKSSTLNALAADSATTDYKSRFLEATAALRK